MIENIETLNKRLTDTFSRYSDGRSLWRLVWSHDELEYRYGIYKDFTAEGFFIREVEEVREVPKYRQWVNPPCYVLERLLEHPEGIPTDMIEKTTYEPVWTFRDANNNPLMPVWGAIKMIIDSVYAASAEHVGVKYRDPREDLCDPKIAVEVREDRLNKLQEELFGNETSVGDALAHGSGLVVPAHYNIPDSGTKVN
jgi:hypothetical protein